jgi:lysylphosphatidylglycerol synthetase-like protein (DUF2156 family)
MTDPHRFLERGRRPGGAILGVAAAVATLLAVAPYVLMLPHQRLIPVAEPLRPMVVLGATALAAVVVAQVQHRAGAWWMSIGLVAAVASDPTPALGGSRSGVLTDLGLLALVLLMGSACIHTRRGTSTAAYGVLIAVASAAGAIVVLNIGYEPDLSLGAALLVIVAVSLVMGLRLRFRRLGRHTPTTAAFASGRHGATHIASTAEMDDRRVAVLPSGHVVSFRQAFGVAVAAGDPLGPRATGGASIREFAGLCRDNGIVPCVYQASPSLTGAYRAAGMRVIKFGEEAVVQLADYTLEGRRRANVRREVGRALRAGLRVEVMRVRDVSALRWQQLEALSAVWELDHGGRELGFSMRRLRDLRHADAAISIVTALDGRIVAFTSWHAMAGGVGLDLMRRAGDAPAGAMDLSIDAELRTARAAGVGFASLGSVPMRDQVDDVPVSGIARRVRRRVYRRGANGYNYRSLAAFKQKFGVCWESRMIAVGGGKLALALPLVMAAVVRLHFADSAPRRGNSAAAGQAMPRDGGSPGPQRQLPSG